MKKKTEPRCFRFTYGMSERLDHYAKKRGLTPSEIIIEILEHYLSNERSMIEYELERTSKLYLTAKYNADVFNKKREIKEELK